MADKDLPKKKRVMPKIIADDIVGVSHMVAPLQSIFDLRVKYKDKDKETK